MMRIKRKFAWNPTTVHVFLSKNSSRCEEIQFRHYFVVQEFWQGSWRNVTCLYSDYAYAYNSLVHLILYPTKN